MPVFTPEQKRVIAHEQGNLLVSAAAGSGKTAVLVERILRLVQGGADIASFLVVTFTRAAADELRERLMLKLEEAVEQDESLKPQLERVELASISTIHAFCLSLLTRYFEKAGVEPNLRTCSEAERIIFQMRAMDTMLDQVYAENEMIKRLERLGSIAQVRLNVESLYRFLMCQIDPLGWLEKYTNEYEKSANQLQDAPWFVRAKGYEMEDFARVMASMQHALAFSRSAQAADCQAMAALIASDIEGVQAYLDGDAQPVKFATWRSPNKRKADDSGELCQLREMRDAYKKAFDSVQKDALVVTDWSQQQFGEMSDGAFVLAEITRRFMVEYARIKKDMGVVDYNDLEQMALKLTQDEMVCDDLRHRYSYIFVDEYQDSSAVQETLLTRVSRGDNTFHVGDVKQSIYGFRQSEPGLFLDEQRRYGKGEGGELISLNRNFRSRQNVLASTNRVFERCMTQGAAGISYDDAARLYPARKEDLADAPTLVQLIDKKAASADDDEDEMQFVRGEVEAVARLVQQLVGTTITGKDGSLRPARYADIVVLRRSVASVLPAYFECFAKAGIPVYSTKGGSFYQTIEIMQVLDYLWAVHNPLEDVHLLGALHGVGGFTAQQIADIRLCGRGQDGEEKRMWTCLIDYRNAPGDEGLGKKVAGFMDLLARMRELARQEKIATLCAVVLEETGALTSFAAMPRGRIRVANLRSLPVRAAEYDNAGLRLGDFLRRIEQTGSRNREEDVPAFSEHDDVVRIMTVHQSKGLEFPIVIGAGLGTRFKTGNDKDADGYMTSRVWCERQYGFALEYYNPQYAASDQTLMTKAIAAIKRKESIAEEMRILYVLMTRARERLVLVGEVTSLHKRMQDWAQPQPQQAAACMLDWLMPAVLSHPDARSVRQAYGLELPEQADSSRWEIRVSMEAEAQEEQEEALPGLGILGEDAPRDEDALAQLRYVYPYRQPQVLRKQSVTELVHGAQDTFFVKELPAFINRDKKLTGAARGSALHRFMEIVDYGRLAVCDDVAQELLAQMDDALLRAHMTGEQVQAVREGVHEIERFVRSDIGRAILSGAQVLREKPFEIRMDEGGEMRLVQGIIDLIVLKEDGAVLVDYKTDHTGLSPESVREKHGDQVLLYKQAAQRAGLVVKKSVVYLFYTGNMVEIE